MTKDKIIDGLKMTMELIVFDPSTGETIDPDKLNDLNRTTYDACNGAIEALSSSEIPNSSDTIPVDWIQKYADDWEDMSYAYDNPILGMLEDWRREQG